jgi:hypothetical protein
MKRLVLAASVLGLAILSTHAVLAMSKGEKRKLGRFAAESLDPFADETDRGKAWEEFVKYFADRKAKDLAEVEDLSEILANAADRKSPGRSGVYEMDVPLSEIGMKSEEKWKIAVNVPKKYSGSGDEAWPLIICIPDKGQDLVEYLDTYWPDPDIRETFLIAVLGFDYSDVTVTEREEVKDEETGKSEFKDVKKKIPFTWDSLAALQRFWWHVRSLQLRTFKADPNRILLDGVGFGREGALSFATGNAWRWAGFVMRGGDSDRPTTQNLKYLRTLYAAPDGGAVPENLKTVLGDSITTAADASAVLAWAEDCKRDRYPLPSTWVAVDPGEYFGYWVLVTEVFESDKPVEITVDSDRKKNEIKVVTNNVREFSLYLNDLLVDMSKDFTLFVNGEDKGQFARARSAEMLLSHAFAQQEGGKPPYDPGCVFTNEMLDITVPAPAIAGGGDGKDGEKDGDKGDGK